LDEFSGSLFYEGFDRVLIGKKVSAENGVFGVQVQIVEFAQYRSGASLGGDCVAPHRVDFRDNRDRQLLRCFGCSDSRAQTRTAAANDNNVMSKHFELYYVRIQ
jgi:hypothetical protein